LIEIAHVLEVPGWIQKFDDTEYPAAVLIPSDQGKMIPEEEKPVKRVSDCGI